MPSISSQLSSQISQVYIDQRQSSQKSTSPRTQSSKTRTANRSAPIGVTATAVAVDEKSRSSSVTSKQSSFENGHSVPRRTANVSTTSSRNSVDREIQKTWNSVSDGTTYGKALYADVEAPHASLDSGVSLVNVELGTVKVGSNGDDLRWGLGIATVTARAGLEYSIPGLSADYYVKSSQKRDSLPCIEYIGFSADATLIKGDFSFDIPLPFTDKELSVTLSGKAFSVGAEANYDRAIRKVTVGASALIGGSVSFGID